MGELDWVLMQLVSSYRASQEHFAEYLEGVDEGSARAEVIDGRHTIWEIVNHCTLGGGGDGGPEGLGDTTTGG